MPGGQSPQKGTQLMKSVQRPGGGEMRKYRKEKKEKKGEKRGEEKKKKGEKNSPSRCVLHKDTGK